MKQETIGEPVGAGGYDTDNDTKPHGKAERVPQVLENVGGASRDRTDDLIVANDDVRRIISLTRLHLAAEYGPLRSNSTHKFNRLAGVASQLSALAAHDYLLRFVQRTNCNRPSAPWGAYLFR